MAFTEREYLSSGVIKLTNSLKISDTTKTEFLRWFSLKVIKKYDKNTGLQIYAVFRTFNLFIVHKRSDTPLCGHSSNPFLVVYNFKKKNNPRGSLFFVSIPNIM